MNEASQIEKNKVQWIEEIKNGDSKALELLYRAYRKEFMVWLCQKMACDSEMALDIFQESVLAFYKNAKMGKLEGFSSSVKTYLFAIGKKIYLYRNRQHKVKLSGLELDDLPIEKLLVSSKDGNSLSDRQALISNLLPKLRPNCKNLLFSFYYEGLRLKEITQKLNYKNVNVAKVMKARCMEALKKMVYQQMKKVG